MRLKLLYDNLKINTAISAPGTFKHQLFFITSRSKIYLFEIKKKNNWIFLSLFNTYNCSFNNIRIIKIFT